MFCPTPQFRKEFKDLTNAHGYWRYLFHLVKHEFPWKRLEKERIFFKVAGTMTALVQKQIYSCYQIFKIKSNSGIYFVQITLNKYGKIMRLENCQFLKELQHPVCLDLCHISCLNAASH